MACWQGSWHKCHQSVKDVDPFTYCPNAVLCHLPLLFAPVMPSRPRILLFTGLAFVVSLFLLTFSPFSSTLGLPSPLSSNKAHRPNGVIFILVNPKRITQALMALYNVEDRFNRRLKYPYVLFTAADEADALTTEVRAKIDHITEGRTTFGADLPLICTHVVFTL